MFRPKYTITNKLLSQIKQVNSLVIRLNQQRFPSLVLGEFEKIARAVSAFASTSIEGNPLPLTEVKKILKSKPEHIRESEKEVLNYNNALADLNRKLKSSKAQLSTKLILKIHKQVTQNLLPEYQSGQLRQQPVIINDPKTKKVVFLPPDVKDVEKLVKELIEFVKDNQSKIDPLIIAGVFHKQMVVIHPFMDGNGRTTRLATKLLLAKLGLNTFNLFSFENYYNQNITRYFKTVGERGDYYDPGKKTDFTIWLEYFTEGIIDELLRIEKLLPRIGFSPDTQIKPFHQKILEHIQKNNFITDKDYAKLVKRAKATRALDFQKLIKLGLISRRGKGKLTFYILKEF
ncbi:Fic family protein [Candidatus Shapirobacteria bacterium]|nr:Fic family protein [Candidatus Shapirobacteria bacterium]